jgi:hypothetical protein
MSKLPPDQTPEELGLPGVEAVMVGQDGHKTVVFNPIQSKVQWPNVSVTSYAFERLDIPAKLYEQALAFLNASKLLCEAAGSSGAAGRSVNWSQGSVCYYCVHIATELFLKACICVQSGEVPKTNDLQKLLASYGAALPEPEFQFQVPLAWQQAASSFENVLDRAPDQLYRYGVGKDGKGSSLTHQFVPDTLFNRIAHLLQVWPRAWNKLCASKG